MKIAQYINSRDGGGAENIVANISRKLTDAGIDNIVIHHGNEWLTELLGQDALYVPAYPLKKMITTGREIGRLLKQHGVTHLHSHLFGATLRGAIIAKFAGIPHTATQHDTYTITEKPSRLRWLKVAEVLGTKLVTVSDTMKDVYQGSGLFKLHPQTIYNGVDTSKYHSIKRTQSDVTRLISVGRLEPVKNYILLIKAMERLLTQQEYKIHLTLVGDGHEYQSLANYVSTRNLTNVTLLGCRTDVPELLNQADLFVLPSFTEGLSCSILEAMACELPVLASDVGGNWELIEPGVNGMLFESDNLDDLECSIFAMIDQGGLSIMGRRSKEIVQNKFSIESMMSQYLALYNA